MLDFRNRNTLWASVLVETLVRCGLRTAIVCPGSRSAPLTVAFAQHPQIKAIPVLDERSASFFALGIARSTKTPVALVCTSGTAGANFYPAVIEARESRVPLLVLTADRPPELRDCNAGQAIDQQKLYADFPNYYAELATPEVDLLPYLRQKIAQAWQQTSYPIPGVVHLNIPLRDPLAPIPQPEIQALEAGFPQDFFQHLVIDSPIRSSWQIPASWHDRRGLIIAGVASPENSERYCTAIANLSSALGYPVLAEGLSPVRNFAALQPALISTYDAILRSGDRAKELAPELVIRIGEMPTSKVLREWLARVKPETWIVDASPRSIDPIHGKSRQIFGWIEDVEFLGSETVVAMTNRPLAPNSGGIRQWLDYEVKLRSQIDNLFQTNSEIIESKVAWLLPQVCPENTAVFISNSMPVRDVEYFWPPNDRHLIPFCNRGANGIDGILSTALGIAQSGQPTVLLTGDLALLHDTNGFLLRQHFQGSLTIVLINNNGGGIFGMLPIAKFEPPFEEFFATPQNINFHQLCQTYGITHHVIADWQDLTQRLSLLPDRGIQVLEIKCDRVQDTQWRQQFQRHAAI
jgi:2-succinyl-5-enolpyruvyl-6-hydroxy-3-cyclohexene-1-carboxylate synthase